MLIDWFTVAAQIINFLILVALLKRFLYRPIIKAMDEREAKIAERLRMAEQHEQEAQQEAASYREKNHDLEDHRAGLIEAAKEEAESLKKDLLQQAREEVESKRKVWYDALRQEQSAFFHDLRRHAGEKVVAISRLALRDLAGEELERLILQRFIERLENIDENTQSAFKEAFARANLQVAVTTGFDIPEDLRTELERTVAQHIPKRPSLRYHKSGDVLAGIELRANGFKIAWNLQDYLTDLDKWLSQEFSKELPGGREPEDEEDMPAGDRPLRPESSEPNTFR